MDDLLYALQLLFFIQSFLRLRTYNIPELFIIPSNMLYICFAVSHNIYLPCLFTDHSPFTLDDLLILCDLLPLLLTLYIL